MSIAKVGRICVKLRGRNAGKHCVITEVLDDTFAEITGPKKITGIKRKRCNIVHLELTKDEINIKKKATDELIEDELKKVKLLKKFKAGIKFNDLHER